MEDLFEVGNTSKKGHPNRHTTRSTPDKVSLPPEPIYEDVVNSTAQSERYRKIRNEQLKNTWLNKCQKIETVGVL